MTCHCDSIFLVSLFHDVGIDDFVSGQPDIMHENTEHNNKITDKFKDYDGLTDEQSEISNRDQTMIMFVTLMIIGQDYHHGSAITSTKIQRFVKIFEEETNGSKYQQDASNQQLDFNDNELGFL